MKHFHVSNEKARLAHEIFTETQILLELEKEVSILVEKIKRPDNTYLAIQQISKDLYDKNKQLKQQYAKVNDLQKRHDNIN